MDVELGKAYPGAGFVAKNATVESLSNSLVLNTFPKWREITDLSRLNKVAIWLRLSQRLSRSSRTSSSTVPSGA
jgi:hypothetical protein